MISKRPINCSLNCFGLYTTFLWARLEGALSSDSWDLANYLVRKKSHVCVECWVVVVASSSEFRRTSMFMRKTEETARQENVNSRVNVAPQKQDTSSKCYRIIILVSRISESNMQTCFLVIQDRYFAPLDRIYEKEGIRQKHARNARWVFLDKWNFVSAKFSALYWILD